MMLHYDINEEVLRDQWAILVRYDKTATNLKGKSTHRRRIVVFIIFFASIASIFTGIQVQPTIIALSIVVVAIILPTVAAVILQDTTTFHGSTDWIKFRFIAETIRMHIYQYRTGTGEFVNCTTKTADNKLNEVVEKSISFIEDAPNLDLLMTIEDEDLDDAIKNANSSSDREDGMIAIKFEDYIEWRVKEQQNWYRRAIAKDRNMQASLTRTGIIMGGLGITIAGLIGLLINPQLVILVAIINIAIVAIESWENVNLIGKSRSIFVTTDEILNRSFTRFKARKNDDDCEANELICQREFVNEVETLLDWERREWYKIVLAAQIEAADVVYEQVAKLAQQNNPNPDNTSTTKDK
ncbi:MAG: hypothetical protein Phog2KO_20940 [Phototrophicaceae bacterium]